METGKGTTEDAESAEKGAHGLTAEEYALSKKIMEDEHRKRSRKWPDLMIDLETLGKCERAAVLEIGAVFFDRETGEEGPAFGVVLRSDQPTRVIDGDTVRWWMQQGEEARKRVLDSKFFLDSRGASQVFRGFVHEHSADVERLRVWGNGPNFDVKIIESLLGDYGVSAPWKFWNVRCVRTVKDLLCAGIEIEREGVAHSAVDDCRHQIKLVCAGVKRLREGGGR